MSVAPFDPLAQAHQQSLRLYAADVQAKLNPGSPGQIPSLPVNGSTGFSSPGDGLGSKESGWERSERFQNQAGSLFTGGGSNWQNFASGKSQKQKAGTGSGQIDGQPLPAKIEKPKLEFPTAANMEQRQGLAYDFAAGFQEYARDALRMLGIGRRTA